MHLVRWLGLTLAATLALELTVRADERIRYGVPFGSLATNRNDLLVSDSQGTHGRPDTHYQKIRLNNLGLRGPDLEIPKPPTVKRVVVVGASEAFGYMESPNKEFPRQLEDSLVARGICTAGVSSIEVANAAMFGQSLPAATQQYALRLRQLGADLVILLPHPVQYLVGEAPRPPVVDSTRQPTPLARTNALHPRFVNRLYEAVKAALPRPLYRRLYARAVSRESAQIAAARARQDATWTFARVPEDRLDAFERDLRVFAGVVREDQVPFVFVIPQTRFDRTGPSGDVEQQMLVSWNRFYPRAEQEVLLAFSRQAIPAVARVASDSGAILVDPRAAFSGPPSTLFADPTHFTDQGAAVMASVLARAIAARPGTLMGCD